MVSDTSRVTLEAPAPLLGSPPELIMTIFSVFASGWAIALASWGSLSNLLQNGGLGVFLPGFGFLARRQRLG